MKGRQSYLWKHFENSKSLSCEGIVFFLSYLELHWVNLLWTMEHWLTDLSSKFRRPLKFQSWRLPGKLGFWTISLCVSTGLRLGAWSELGDTFLLHGEMGSVLTLPQGFHLNSHWNGLHSTWWKYLLLVSVWSKLPFQRPPRKEEKKRFFYVQRNFSCIS